MLVCRPNHLICGVHCRVIGRRVGRTPR
ncbi:hypothetical protein GJ631_11475 [Natronomonas sp. CBA1123]|nr:hypothetical protein [Natronomonas sp. CBA1123]